MLVKRQRSPPHRRSGSSASVWAVSTCELCCLISGQPLTMERGDPILWVENGFRSRGRIASAAKVSRGVAPRKSPFGPARSERRRVGDRHRGGQVAAALPQPGRVVAPRLCRLRRTRGGSGLIDGPRPTPPKQHARPGRAGPSLPEFQIALPWAALMCYGAGIQLGSTSAASGGRSALIAIIVTVYAGTRAPLA